jgi:hypothetical protein
MLLAGENLVGNPGVTSSQRPCNHSTADKPQPFMGILHPEVREFHDSTIVDKPKPLTGILHPASVAQAIYELKDSVERPGLSTDGPIIASNAYFAPSALASVISRNTSAIFRTKSAGESRSPCRSRAPS